MTTPTNPKFELDRWHLDNLDKSIDLLKKTLHEGDFYQAEMDAVHIYDYIKVMIQVEYNKDGTKKKNPKLPKFVVFSHE
jgi:hypothetical protein